MGVIQCTCTCASVQTPTDILDSNYTSSCDYSKKLGRENVCFFDRLLDPSKTGFVSDLHVLGFHLALQIYLCMFCR